MAPGGVTYALHSLGWKAFQDLCGTILRTKLSPLVQSFSPSRDGGRDGAFEGEWQREAGQGVDGSLTVQCKHTSISDVNFSARAVKSELNKALALVKRGLADNYLLLTNYKVSAEAAATVEDRLRSMGVQYARVYGKEWIDATITESQKLRMLVPRVYGLGDLSQILDLRASAQAEEIVNGLRSDLPKLVVTGAYQKSALALDNRGFVMILGEPAIGKSTIAGWLSVVALDRWQAPLFKLRRGDDFARHWHPDEPNRLYWFDDVFGTTQYQPELAREWNSIFPHLRAAIRAGSRVLFTSRNYIYNAAVRDLKTGDFPLITDSQVVVDAHELTISEKEQMVYNHLKLGGQSQEFRKSIKRFLPTVAASRGFLPETARRLGDPLFTRDLRISDEGVRAFVEEPVPFLVAVVRTLDTASFAALALLFTNGGALQTPLSPSDGDHAVLELLDSTVGAVRKALHDMEGSLLRQTNRDGLRWWEFRHPTVSDALAEIMGAKSEYTEVYLRGAKAEKLSEEVVCAGVTVENAKVVVPPSLYPILARRLAELPIAKRISFFAARCDRGYLTEYVASDDSVTDSMVAAVGPGYGWTSGAALLRKLSDMGILRPDVRSRIVGAIAVASAEGPDAGFLTSPHLCGFLSGEELTLIWDHLRSHLVPAIEDVVAEWEADAPDNRDDADDHFHSLTSALESMQDHATEPEVAEACGRALSAIEAFLEDLPESVPDRDDDDDSWPLDSDFRPDTRDVDRSVFDDVDE